MVKNRNTHGISPPYIFLWYSMMDQIELDLMRRGGRSAPYFLRADWIGKKFLSSIGIFCIFVEGYLTALINGHSWLSTLGMPYSVLVRSMDDSIILLASLIFLLQDLMISVVM